MFKLIQFLCLLIYFNYALAGEIPQLPKQVDIQNAKHVVNDNGIPLLNIDGLGLIHNPATVSVYALAYGGYENYSNDIEVKKDQESFKNCLKWLIDNLQKNKNGSWVWYYNFDHSYNDINVKAPWYSGFGQAVGVDALLAAYDTFQDPLYLEKAKQAAEIFSINSKKGGLLFQKGNDIWFEEILNSLDNPSHILNGHMRALITLKKLADITHDKKYLDLFEKGIKTLIKWLPLYDNGYWLRYDLNPQKFELGFRFNNPYGNKLVELPIHKVTLHDPVTNKDSTLQLGIAGDSEGALRFAGNDWGQPEILDGKSIRRLLPVQPADYSEQLDGNAHHSPGTYFYLTLPSKWKDNLRSEWFELIVTYKDEVAGNIALQKHTIAPGPAFQWMKDGDLLLTGSGKWREWRIPLRSSDLGFYCGKPYDKMHLLYLEKLSQWEPKLKTWVELMRGYHNIFDNDHAVKTVQLEKQILPKQTALLPLTAIDKDGVIQQYMPSDSSRFTNGYWDHSSNFGQPIYQLFLIAEQARLGGKSAAQTSLHAYNELQHNKYIIEKKVNFVSIGNIGQLLRREPAYKYLLDNATVIKDNALLWHSYFLNAYNDIEIQEGWSSSFTQAYVIKALKAAIDDKITVPQANYNLLLEKALNGYTVSLQEGGFLLRTHHNYPFFQEFSLAPHSVINAHLISLSSIKEAITYMPKLSALYQEALHTIKEHIHLYDTGYWLRYDLNPKKEMLFQIDWIQGEKSPLIESISLENPQTEEQTLINVNEDQAFKAYPYIVGTDWSEVEHLDDKKGRSFINGYSKRLEPVKNGAHHNVYFMMSLPNRTFNNDFIIPSFKLRIRYKDIAPGAFQFKAKPIHMNNHHTFFPIRESILVCNGDQKWKEAIIMVRPQELGWYVGPDYQKFHAEQIKLIGEQTDDWFFKQQGERHQHFFNIHHEQSTTVNAPKSNNKYYMSTDDPKNPLSIFLKPIPHEIKKISDNLVSQKRYQNKFELVKDFMEYSSDFKIAIPSEEPGSDYLTSLLKQRVGSCGNFSNLLAAMLATQNIPSRIISLYNFPTNAGHVVLEVLLDDKWILVDPTYASYFVSIDDKNNEKILNFQDLRSGKYIKKKLQHIILNQKRYQAYGQMAKNFAGLDIYRKADPAGVIPETKMYFPLYLNLITKKSIDTKEPQNQFKNQGSSFIGKADVDSNLKISIDSLDKSQKYNLKIFFKGVGGKNLDSLSIFKAYAHNSSLKSSPISKMEYPIKNGTTFEWNIPFVANNKKETFFISHDHTKQYVYLVIDKISIIK